MSPKLPLLLVTLLLPLAACTSSDGSSNPAGQKNPDPAAAPAGTNPEKPAPTFSADPALGALQRFIAEKQVAERKANPAWRTALPKPPQVEFDATKTYAWNLKTNKGDIKVKLDPKVAPMHVSSTIYLTELGYYDGIGFHRVITDFMAQGGCPFTCEGMRGRPGTGGPGYQYDGEFDPKVKHDRPGLLSMANSGPGTDGSQFFLTFKATPWLDGKHTLFGEVVDGMSALRRLEERGSQSGDTSEPLRIEKATITIE